MKLQWKKGIRKSKGKHFSKCIDCGKELNSYRKSNPRCRKCYIKFHRGKNHEAWLPDHYCIDCGKKLWKHYKSIRCQKCNNKFHSGDKNGRWIDGRSYKKYSSFFIALSKLIRKRDDYKCQICGLTDKEYRIKAKRALDVHHIDHNKDNNVGDNLITVCRKCHKLL